MARVGTKVLLVGALPPPVGGVSIHLSRFLARSAQSRYEVAVLDLRKVLTTYPHESLYGYGAAFRAFMVSDIIHIHVSNNIKLLIALLSRVLGKRVIYTHHNNVIKSSALFLMMYFLCHTVVFVNGQCVPTVLRKRKCKRKWVVIPAFIPPEKGADLPSSLMKKVAGYEVVISFNAYRRSFIGGEEVYGVDLMLKLYERLVSSGRLTNFCFVFLDPSGTHKDQVSKFTGRNDAAGSEFVYVDDDVSFFSLLQKSTLSIRPTRTDGDSLSVRESLALGIPVVASNVVERPEGCVSFLSGNVEDLERKVLDVLRDKTIIQVKAQDFFDPIIGCYNRLRDKSS